MKTIALVIVLLALVLVLDNPIFWMIEGIVGLAGGLFGLGIGLIGGLFGLVVGLAAGMFGAVVGILGALFGIAVAVLTLAIPLLIVCAVAFGILKLVALA